jgi:orotidine-5'-phosphate decarboxylase
MPHNPVLVALDTRTAEDAVRLAKSLVGEVGGFKVGLRLLLGPGPATVSALAGLGKPVFADAKLHDIPSQVQAAAERLGAYGARWVTAHAAGGGAMLTAAAAGLQAGAGSGAGVLAVTVLTSLGASDLADIGMAGSPGKTTSRLSRLAETTGVEGVICSPLELRVVAEVAPGLVRVTPGIRPDSADEGDDDQERVATPAAAIARGADWLVVGRPITAAPDPPAAAAAIAAEAMEAAE